MLVEKSELWVYKAAKPDDKKVKLDPCESISELCSVLRHHSVIVFYCTYPRPPKLVVSYMHKLKRFFFRIFLFMYVIPHCFICRPSDSTVSVDAEIEPRTVATLALTGRRSNHWARPHPQTRLDLFYCTNMLAKTWLLVYFSFHQFLTNNFCMRLFISFF